MKGQREREYTKRTKETNERREYYEEVKNQIILVCIQGIVYTDQGFTET